ncbi:MAG: hypothetical protein QQN55_01200 [Nitrosopumilus sp.]
MDILFNTTAEIDKHGKLHFDKKMLQNACHKLKQPEKRSVRILIIEDFKDLTKKQLNYYHGFLLKDVIQAHKSIGDRITEKECDDYLREKFLFHYKTNIITGRKTKIVKSLKLDSVNFPSTKEISQFFEDVCQYCAENMSFTIYLPDDLKDIDLNFDRKEKESGCIIHSDKNNCVDFLNIENSCKLCKHKTIKS